MQHGSDARHAAQVERIDGLQHMHIAAGQIYKSPGEAYVEGDASSASYFLAGDSPAGQLGSLQLKCSFICAWKQACTATVRTARIIVTI